MGLLNNDLISRSALLDELKQQRDLETEIFTSAVNDGITTGIRVAIQLTKAAPAVDAVEVVRCENCIYNDSETHIPDLSIAIFSTAQKTLTGTAMKEKGEQNERNTY